MAEPPVLFGGGINAEPYRPVIEERVGRPVILMDNYNATEGGIFAVTDRVGEPGMLIVPDRGVFFEFVPAAEHGKPDARRLPLWEVEPGVDYSIAVTTASGLFAYLIGDLVQFQSVFPHRMEFVGRTSGVLSLTQELTSFVEESSAPWMRRCGRPRARWWSSPPVRRWASSGTGKGRYQIFVEFDQPPAESASLRAVRSTRASARRTASTGSTARRTSPSCRPPCSPCLLGPPGGSWTSSAGGARSRSSRGSSRILSGTSS